jgi:hypothetical protein
MAKNQVDAFGNEVCSIVGEKIMLKTMAKAPAAPSLGQEGITEFGGNRKMARMLCHQKLSRNVENHPQIDQMASCCGSRHDMLKMQPCPSVHPVHPIRPLIHHPFTNCIHSNAHPPFPSQSRFHQSIHPSIHSSIHPFKPSIPIPVPSIEFETLLF